MNLAHVLGAVGLAISLALIGYGIITWKRKEAFGARLKAEAEANRMSITNLKEQVRDSLEATVERVDRMSAKRGKSSLADKLLEADLEMRTSEFIGIQIMFAALLGAVSLWRWGIVPFVVGAVAGYLLPTVYLKYRTAKRLRVFNSQLPQALNALANALRAGYSLPQALESVGETLESPTGPEFSRVIREVNLGGTVEDSLEQLVRRIKSEDLDLVVTAILVHRSIGGNLAEILSNIGHTIRERIRIKGEIRTLTAQARLSGLFITLIPVGLAILLSFIAPSYFAPMTGTVLGWAGLALAGIMILFGNFVMRKFTQIEI